MTPAEAAREVAERLQMECRITYDYIESQTLYKTASAFRQFAELLETDTKEGDS